MSDKLLLGSTLESAGSTGNNVFSLGYYVCQFSGSINYIYLRLGGTTKAKVAVYADSAGSPGALLVASAEADCVSGWNAIAISPLSVSKDSYYWLALIYESAVKRYFGATETGTQKYKSVTYSGFSFPNPAGGGFSSNTRAIAEYGYGSDIVGGFPLIGDGLVGEQVFFGPSKFFG